MPLNAIRLKNKIKAVMDDCSQEVNDPALSKEQFAQKLAEAVIFEITNMTITATAPNGAVTIISIT